MKLKKLLKDIPYRAVKGSKEIEITGICSHSKMVAPGNLFIAQKGAQYDGTQFIPDAVAAGAHAIVTDIYDPFLEDCVQVICENVAQVAPLFAANYYQNPSHELNLIGITGTNGKTTTSYLIYHILQKAHIFSGLIGTIEYILGNNRIIASRTTPDVILNHKFLRDMKTQGCQAAIMEVSSHALVQKRVENIDFSVAVFTNLTTDHLDYHKNLSNYQQAKSLLFTQLQDTSVALFNHDDPISAQFMEKTNAQIMTYGLYEGSDIVARDIHMSLTKTVFTVEYKDQKEEISLPLIGKYNIYNALAAIGVGLFFQLSLADMKHSLSCFPGVPGRMEKVGVKGKYHIFVDYAHTPDGLENVLRTLQEIKEGRVICLFGCGGDRDSSKRKDMGAIAEKYADISIVTSDNPRSEDPKDIAQQIVQGFSSMQNLYVELDRKEAIRKALSLADKKDIILIAGKGHEMFQVFANQTIAFDDRKVIRELLNES